MSTATLEKKPEVKEKSARKCHYKAPIAIYETGNAYTVFVEMPGADEHAVNVRVDRGVLTIEAPLKLDLPEGITPTYSEMRLGDYRRTLDLGDLIDQDKIDATFRSGVLKLTLPKSKGAKAVKVPIKTV